eukprot:756511-Hanusia_phi.AAC.1
MAILPVSLATPCSTSQLLVLRVGPTLTYQLLQASPPLLASIAPPLSSRLLSHLRLFLRFSPSLPFDSSGYFIHARVHGSVAAAAGVGGEVSSAVLTLEQVYGAGLQLGGGNLSGFLELPNVLRECKKSRCVELVKETGGECLPG